MNSEQNTPSSPPQVDASITKLMAEALNMDAATLLQMLQEHQQQPQGQVDGTLLTEQEQQQGWTNYRDPSRQQQQTPPHRQRGDGEESSGGRGFAGHVDEFFVALTLTEAYKRPRFIYEAIGDYSEEAREMRDLAVEMFWEAAGLEAPPRDSATAVLSLPHAMAYQTVASARAEHTFLGLLKHALTVSVAEENDVPEWYRYHFADLEQPVRFEYLAWTLLERLKTLPSGQH
ncbi:protein ORF86 [Cyprinid herpesvirus 3]|uniref:ORF86L n=1 Tax=Cyprinid herpesvirus 3 TaxID=180230 RepID=A3QMQ4_CYHV3|nr:unnamed protein product [Cyprinid herpesvirus 3]ABC55159.1 hypothetical protein [Cyprinid herpesvirus 3]ABG42913.1 protein ORF86 [Cyprinid herpesvirus 3]AIC32441.1 ORF86L [Cyprinid herpesvirus 3]AJP55574.1 protein ORF86 [Cyprinid herpesvirus 3]AJP55729.1 protein ORF86 [Cyprinid herpesvirus 3]